jgi:hypothetical protein
MDAGVIIPVVAILGSFAIPITAIVMDFRRRKLQFEERRVMIERGMQPPPLAEHDRMGRTPEERRDRSLRSGIMSLSLGVGLAVASFLLLNVLTDTFIPSRVAGPMAVGAAVMGFIGIGNLVHYAILRKQGGGGAAA